MPRKISIALYNGRLIWDVSHLLLPISSFQKFSVHLAHKELFIILHFSMMKNLHIKGT